MKKIIALCSYYVSGNIGDLLIAEQVTKLFSNIAECKMLNMDGELFHGYQLLSRESPVGKTKVKTAILSHPVFGNAIKLIKAITSKKPTQFAEHTKECDWVIFAGGNQIMELCRLPIGTLMLRRIVSLLKKKGKCIAFCFCGVGPLNGRVSRFMTKQILKNVDYLSVRDDASLELIKQLDPTVKVEIWRDPVLALHVERKYEKLKSRRIGINVFFGPEIRIRKQVKESYISFIKKISEEYHNYQICLFSSTQSDYLDISECMEVLSDFSNINTEMISSIDELFDLIGSFEFVIGTRMHTLISSMCSEIPIMAISWQEKVLSLMEYIHSEDLCVSQRELIDNPYHVNEVFNAAFGKKTEIVKANNEILCNTRIEIETSIERFKKGIYYGSI